MPIRSYYPCSAICPRLLSAAAESCTLHTYTSELRHLSSFLLGFFTTPIDKIHIVHVAEDPAGFGASGDAPGALVFLGTISLRV